MGTFFLPISSAASSARRAPVTPGMAIRLRSRSRSRIRPTTDIEGRRLACRSGRIQLATSRRCDQEEKQETGQRSEHGGDEEGGEAELFGEESAGGTGQRASQPVDAGEERELRGCQPFVAETR